MNTPTPQDTAHLSALAIDAAALHEPLPAAAAAHLAGCAVCQARLAEVQAFDDALRLAPPAAPSNVVSLDAMRRRRLRWIGAASGVLAAAAALLLVVRGGPTAPEPGLLPETPDVLRARGGEALSAFDVTFYLRAAAGEDATVRPIGDGDVVGPGDRLRFRLALPGHAHVAILGVDAAGTTYRCHPQGDGDELAEHHGAGAPATTTEVDVPDTVAFDDAAGSERIVAIACAEPRSLQAIEHALAAAATAADPTARLPVLAPGCVQREVRLHKRREEP